MEKHSGRRTSIPIPLAVGLLALAMLLAWLALPTSVMADGFIIASPPGDRPTLSWRDVPIAVKYHRVEVDITDQVATTHVDQVFVNDASFTVEGTYVFPLPEDAAISSFDMTVDGTKYEGKLLGREEARDIYESIVRQQRDPALLEYVGRGMFQASIFPIPPGAERRIELTYTQVLKQDAGLVYYRYPLNIERYSSRPIPDVKITVQLEDRARLRAIYSPTHPVEVSREGAHRATVSHWAVDVLPDRDFDLYYSVSQDVIAANLLSYKLTGEDGFFLLLVTPPVEPEEEPVAKDVVLVLDTSSSMEGDKIEQLREAAAYVLDQLQPGDRFNIISFNSFVRLFAEDSQALSRREEGLAFIRKLQPQGSTDINRALLEATAGTDEQRPTIIIFLTDGLPTAGETNADRIVDNVGQSAPKSVRLFAFGVGFDVDTTLLDQLSSGLRGASSYVRPDEAIDEKVSAFYAKVSMPVLVDVDLRFSEVTAEDMYPYPLPDLFAGTQLAVVGRYRDSGTSSLRLSGNVNNEPRSYTYKDLQFVRRGGNEFIPRLWAQRKIAYLLTQIRIHGAADELVREVVELSTRYGIVTPYTSFLVEEPPSGPTSPVVERIVRETVVVERELPLERVVKETVIVEKEVLVEKIVTATAALSSQERSGEKAVDQSQAERELSTQDYAAAAEASGQVRQVGDKAFVLREGAWIDTSLDTSITRVEQIAFGSDRYFQLLQQHPEIAPFLALGDRVTVAIDDQVYAIGPAGETAAQPMTTPPASGDTLVGVAAATPTIVGESTSSSGRGSLLWPAAIGIVVVGLLILALIVWSRRGRRA